LDIAAHQTIVASFSTNKRGSLLFYRWIISSSFQQYSRHKCNRSAILIGVETMAKSDALLLTVKG